MNKLTGLRFPLALIIVLCHTMGSIQSNEYTKLVLPILNFSSICTSIFLILSGFSLSYVYSSKKITTISFLKKRLAKIYPLFIISFFLCFIYFYAGYLKTGTIASHYQIGDHYHTTTVKESVIVNILSILLINAWNPFYFSINYPAWTLSCLFFAYLLFPAILKSVSSFSLRKTSIYLMAMCLIAYIYPIILIIYQNTVSYESHFATFYSTPQALYGVMHRNPLVRLPEFIAGMLLFRLYTLNRKVQHNTKQYYSVLTIIAVVLALTFVAPNIPFPIEHNAFFIPLELCLIYFIFKEENYFTKALSSNFLNSLGKISLPIYLLHVPIFQLWTVLCHKTAILLKLGQLRTPYLPDFRISGIEYILFLIILISTSILAQKYIVDYFYNMYLKRIESRHEEPRMETAFIKIA